MFLKKELLQNNRVEAKVTSDIDNDIFDKENNVIGDCHYHLCKKEKIEVFTCSYCHKQFCSEHIEPKCPKPPFGDSRHYEIEKRANYHPCQEYYEYILEKEKEHDERIAKSLNKMSRNTSIKIRNSPYKYVKNFPPYPKEKFAKTKIVYKCSFCSYTTQHLTRCKYCGDLFCENHIEPKTLHESLRTKGGHPCKEFTEIQKSQQQKQLISEKDEANIPYMAIEPEKHEKNNKHSFKINFSLVIIIILLTIALTGSYYILQQNFSNLTEEKSYLENELFLTDNDIKNTDLQLNLSTTQLEKINADLQDNISKTSLLKTGDNYSLHDPLFNDVIKFIEDDKSRDLLIEIDNSKEQGIQCFYIIVRLADSSSSVYDLIGFNTTDKGMIYFEPETDYRVYPKIGKSYVACVEGKPYYTTFDDTIKEILTIW